MKCNYKTLATSDLEAMLRKRLDEAFAIRQELSRRRGETKPVADVNFSEYLTD